MTTIYKLLFCIILIIPLESCLESPEPTTNIVAEASLHGMNAVADNEFTIDESISYGKVVFIQKDTIVTATVTLSGFDPHTSHAIHIHTGDCNSPGSHWNKNLPMTERFCNTISIDRVWGRPMAGDIGNVEVGEDGTGTLKLETNFWSLEENKDKSILNLVVIVHENPQDFTAECQPDHGNHPHYNSKVACGTIEPVFKSIAQ